MLLLKNIAPDGLSKDPGGLATGANGGYQAVNIAVLAGASRIVLLGYDCKDAKDGRAHWFGDHPEKHVRPHATWLTRWRTVAPIAKRLGVEIINCSPESAIDCFTRASIESVLPDPPGAAVSQ